jgi:glycosyltransferase involved in cell wall biosynthesis
MAPPRLSVLIPAYDNGAALDLTLASLARQTLPVDEFDVVVADDGSAEPLAAVTERHAGRLHLTYLRSERNRGRAANRNLAATAARAGVLLFLDADTVAHPDLLTRHGAFHARQAPAPGVLLGRRFEIDWAGLDALRRGEPVVPAMTEGSRSDWRDLQLAAPHHRRDFDRAPWLYAYTHNVSVDRASFERVGGFDEAIVGWGFAEDLELFYRVFHLHDAVPTVFAYDERAHSYHLPHLRPAQRQADRSGENERYFFGKHPRYDVELAIAPGGGWGRKTGRIHWYDEAIATCRRTELGRVTRLPGVLRDALAARRALVVGLGAAKLALGAGSHTVDHDAPLIGTNWHLAGLRLPFEDGQFEVVVNVDLWRFFAPEELGVLVFEALRIAGEARLVATAGGPDPVASLPVPFVADVEDLARMLRPHLAVTVAVSGDGDLTELLVGRL